MSHQFKNFSSLVNPELLEEIESLNLPLIQKHHVRLLIHCLQVFREISEQNENISLSNKDLKLWCELESSQFLDRGFSDLLFEQMCSAKKKLEDFSNEVNKDLLDLNVYDLAELTKVIPKE